MFVMAMDFLLLVFLAFVGNFADGLFLYFVLELFDFILDPDGRNEFFARTRFTSLLFAVTQVFSSKHAIKCANKIMIIYDDLG